LKIVFQITDGKAGTPPKIDAPQALRLRREPKANVERYDALRSQETARAS
jgi:hypothetical protein